VDENSSSNIAVDAAPRRSLRKDRSLYQDHSSDTDSHYDNKHYAILELEKLVPFPNHPFKIYEGTQLEQMVISIREKGVINPIAVRSLPHGKGKYEIISGHNRVNASREAGLTKIPAIIMYGLTDDEAMLMVTDSNFSQRSFSDISHSERAKALFLRNEAIKRIPGYRSDLHDEPETTTGDPVGTRSRTREKIGKQYGLGGTTIARYIRIYNLIPELMERLDNKEFGTHAADSLSSLETGAQSIVEAALATGGTIDTEKAKTLHQESRAGELSREDVDRILASNTQKGTAKTKPINISAKLYSRFFNESQNPEEIEDIISKALESYLHNTQNAVAE
jgi:ParB family chromosome partitioning protein